MWLVVKSIGAQREHVPRALPFGTLAVSPERSGEQVVDLAILECIGVVVKGRREGAAVRGRAGVARAGHRRIKGVFDPDTGAGVGLLLACPVRGVRLGLAGGVQDAIALPLGLKRAGDVRVA